MKIFNKYKKYNQIILVDVENIGTYIQENIPKKTLIIMVAKKSMIKTLTHSRYHQKNLVLLSMSDDYKTKNAMDFVIVSKMNEIVPYLSKKQSLIILSKDKGFDVAIDYIKSIYSQLSIERLGMQIHELFYYNGKEDTVQYEFNKYLSQQEWPEWVKKAMTPNMIKKCIMYDNDINHLNKKEQEKLIYMTHVHPVFEVKTVIKYDIKNNKYVIRHNQKEKRTVDFDEGLRIYQECIQTTEKKYCYYKNRAIYYYAHQNGWKECFEDASLNQKPLEQAFVDNLGEEEGQRAFREVLARC